MQTHLCKQGQYVRKISERLVHLEVQLTTLEKQHQTTEVEFQRQQKGLVLAIELATEEMNKVFTKRTTKPVVSKPARSQRRVTARSTLRTGKHWTPEEKEGLEHRIERLLTGSPGLTATTIANKLRVGGDLCRKVVRDMKARGLLRVVTIDVTFGRGMVRKMEGYALPLKAVASAEKAA